MPRWGSTVRPQCLAEDRSWTWLQPLSLSCIFNIPSLFQEHSPRTTDPAPIEPASYSITRHESHAHTPDETAARPPLRPINLPPRLPSPFATRPATARRHLPRSINSKTTTPTRPPSHGSLAVQTRARLTTLHVMTPDTTRSVDHSHARHGSSDLGVLVGLWEEARFPRLPCDAPNELRDLTEDVDNPKRVHVIHKASRRHNFQSLVQK